MTATPAPDDLMWMEGLRWTEAVIMQADRLQAALSELQVAYADARMRASLNAGDDEGSRQWRAGFDAEHSIGTRPTRVPSWALEMQVANEGDFLLISVRNVLRAADRLPAAQLKRLAGETALKLLRDVAEHYDESGGRAERALKRDHPEILRGVLAYTKDEVWIGGERGVPLSRVLAWAVRTQAAFRDALRTLDIAAPTDLLASRVAGDDELPWPSDRLHYGWWLPAPDESEWPTGGLPDELADLLSERFRRLREMDSQD